MNSSWRFSAVVSGKPRLAKRWRVAEYTAKQPRVAVVATAMISAWSAWRQFRKNEARSWGRAESIA
jgi:hypothetical protein